MESNKAHRSELAAALLELRDGISENEARHATMKRRIGLILNAIDEGRRLSDVSDPKGGAPLAQLLSQNIEVLTHAGTRARRAQVRVLADEGWSNETIATALGVSRQRIGKILKASDR